VTSVPILLVLVNRNGTFVIGDWDSVYVNRHSESAEEVAELELVSVAPSTKDWYVLTFREVIFTEPAVNPAPFPGSSASGINVFVVVPMLSYT
jgi:hypothetical protein